MSNQILKTIIAMEETYTRKSKQLLQSHYIIIYAHTHVCVYRYVNVYI